MIDPKDMVPLLEAIIKADSILASPKMDNGHRDKALDTSTEADNLLYVVFPGPGGRQWMVQQVAKAVGSFEGRKPLPEAWAGLRDEAFAKATGVADGVFCHPGRFIGGAQIQGGGRVPRRPGGRGLTSPADVLGLS